MPILLGPHTGLVHLIILYLPCMAVFNTQLIILPTSLTRTAPTLWKTQIFATACAVKVVSFQNTTSWKLLIIVTWRLQTNKIWNGIFQLLGIGLLACWQSEVEAINFMLTEAFPVYILWCHLNYHHTNINCWLCWVMVYWPPAHLLHS